MEEEELSSEVEGMLSPEIELEGDENDMNFSSEVESCNSISSRTSIDIAPSDLDSGKTCHENPFLPLATMAMHSAQQYIFLRMIVGFIE